MQLKKLQYYLCNKKTQSKTTQDVAYYTWVTPLPTHLHIWTEGTQWKLQELSSLHNLREQGCFNFLLAGTLKLSLFHLVTDPATDPDH